MPLFLMCDDFYLILELSSAFIELIFHYLRVIILPCYLHNILLIILYFNTREQHGIPMGE